MCISSVKELYASVQVPEYEQSATPKSPISPLIAHRSLLYFEIMLAPIPDIDARRSIEKLSKH